MDIPNPPSFSAIETSDLAAMGKRIRQVIAASLAVIELVDFGLAVPIPCNHLVATISISLTQASFRLSKDLFQGLFFGAGVQLLAPGFTVKAR
jgi:hypothetical protein